MDAEIMWGDTNSIYVLGGYRQAGSVMLPHSVEIREGGQVPQLFKTTGIPHVSPKVLAFATAVRECIQIVSILFNNYSMAMELPIMPISTEKYRATDIGGNYADRAIACRGYSERITEQGDIVAALKHGIVATERDQPAVLEFIICKELEMSLMYSSCGK